MSRSSPRLATNFDAGTKFRAGQVSGGAYLFVNHYKDFIAQDVTVAVTPARTPLAQAINYADVRISGVELTADAPIVLRHGVVTIAGAGAYTRGTIQRAVVPGGLDLSGTPADNITPLKVIASARFTDPRGRWWVEYGVRSESEVKRVARALLDSPFLIAQDLLSLDGFTGTAARLGCSACAWTRSRRADVCDREPDQCLLPRPLPVCAGARAQRHRGSQHRSVLRRGISLLVAWRRVRAEGIRWGISTTRPTRIDCA